MDAGQIALSIPIVAIICGTLVRIAKVRNDRDKGSVPSDVTARMEALEHDVQALQQGLVETQERLDFTERLLSKTRDEKRLGS